MVGRSRILADARTSLNARYGRDARNADRAPDDELRPNGYATTIHGWTRRARADDARPEPSAPGTVFQQRGLEEEGGEEEVMMLIQMYATLKDESVTNKWG